MSENGEGVLGDAATAGQCADGAKIGQADGIVVSADGENVYVGSFSNAVLAFSRSPVNGAITQLSPPDGCVSETGDGGACENGIALSSPRSVAITPDGNHVYASSQGSDALVVFSPTGDGVAVFGREAAAPGTTPPTGTDGQTGGEDTGAEDEKAEEPAGGDGGTDDAGVAGDGGGSLPFTGFRVLLLIVLGIPLVLTGVVARGSLKDRG